MTETASDPESRTVPRALGRRIGPVAIAVLVLLSSGLVAPTAAKDAPSPSFVVDLHADGSATVTATFTFDLTSDAERVAFEALANDSAAREDMRSRFEQRLAAVVAAAENRTDRSMAISDPTIDIRTVGETGVVTVTVDWSGLARSSDGSLVVTEPFASEFSPDRRFVFRVPDGYEVTSVTPAPDTRTADTLEWAAGSDLSGFEVRLTQTAADGTAEPTTTDEPADASTETPGQPGFGIGLAIAALLTALALLARRRRGT